MARAVLSITQVNSEKAAELKQHWGVVVNLHAQLKSATSAVDVEAYKFLDVTEAQRAAKVEEVLAAYAGPRDKVGEIAAARALARPVPSGQSRKSIVDKVLSTVAALDAQLSPQLRLRLDRSSKEE